MLLSELAAGQHSVFPGLVEVYDKIVRRQVVRRPVVLVGCRAGEH
jgi:hypothetical protein